MMVSRWGWALVVGGLTGCGDSGGEQGTGGGGGQETVSTGTTTASTIASSGGGSTTSTGGDEGGGTTSGAGGSGDGGSGGAGGSIGNGGAGGAGAAGAGGSGGSGGAGGAGGDYGGGAGGGGDAGGGGSGGGPDLPAGPEEVIAADGTDPDVVDVTWTEVPGAVSYEIAIDDGAWFDVGTDTAYLDVLAPGGTFIAGTPVASDGTLTTAVDIALGSVELLAAPDRTYRVRAVLVDGVTTESADTGYRLTEGPVVLQWQRSAGDADADYADLPGAFLAVDSDPTAPENGEGRFYRALLTATGAGPTPTLADRGHRTLEAPLGVAASDGTDTGGVVVTWTAAPGALGYEVHDGTQWNDVDAVTFWRDDAAPMGFVQLAPPAATDGAHMRQVRVTSAAPVVQTGAPRTYRVRAIGASAPGLESTSDEGFRGVGGTATVRLQRSLADSPANYATIVESAWAWSQPEWMLDDSLSDRPIDPDGRHYRFEVEVAGAPIAVSDADRGYVRPRPQRTYTVVVRTGTVSSAGTDEQVHAAFYDPLDYSSGLIEFDGPGNDLEAGASNTFTFASNELGTSMCMNIHIHDADGSSGINGWYGRDVTLRDDLGNEWIFPLGNWLDSGQGFGTEETICL